MLYFACQYNGYYYHSLRKTQYPDMIGFAVYFGTIVVLACLGLFGDDKRGNFIEAIAIGVYTVCVLTSLAIFNLYGEITLRPLGPPTGDYGVGYRRFWVKGKNHVVAFYPTDR